MVDQEAVDLEILDIACKVNFGFYLFIYLFRTDNGIVQHFEK